MLWKNAHRLNHPKILFLPCIFTEAVKGLQTSDFRLQTSDFRLQTSDFRLQTSDLRLQTSDLRLQTSDFRLQTSDFRLQTSDFKLQTSDFRLQTSDFRLQTLVPSFANMAHCFCVPPLRITLFLLYSLVYTVSYLFKCICRLRNIKS